MHSPMEQFEIKRLLHLNLFGIDASFTNSSTWMIIAVILATAVFVWGMRQRALVPGKLQSVAELGYEFIAGMVRDNVGDGGKKYFPFILTLFIFILFCNVLGLVPYSFTPTSHIVVTFAMAAFVFVGVTIIGFARHGAAFPVAVRAERRAVRAPAAAGADRDHLLLHPAVQPVDPAVRQHAGRPHHAEGVRRLRGHARASSAAGRRWPSSSCSPAWSC